MLVSPTKLLSTFTTQSEVYSIPLANEQTMATGPFQL